MKLCNLKNKKQTCVTKTVFVPLFVLPTQLHAFSLFFLLAKIVKL